MAKIGELYRLDGNWQGHRILTEDWIAQSTQHYSNGVTDPDVFSDEFSGYGYQWWTTKIINTQGREFDMYYADGYGRQYIFVVPEFNAVIVSTADNYIYDGPGMGTVMRENLLSAFNPNDDDFIPISNNHNGSWYFPEHDGQGINFEIINQGNNFVIYATSGGVFVNSQPIEVIEWGQGTLTVFDCISGHFTFESNTDNVDEDVSGEFPLSRLTASTGDCLNNNKSKQTRHELR